MTMASNNNKKATVMEQLEKAGKKTLKFGLGVLNFVLPPVGSIVSGAKEYYSDHEARKYGRFQYKIWRLHRNALPFMWSPLTVMGVLLPLRPDLFHWQIGDKLDSFTNWGNETQIEHFHEKLICLIIAAIILPMIFRGLTRTTSSIIQLSKIEHDTDLPYHKVLKALLKELEIKESKNQITSAEKEEIKYYQKVLALQNPISCGNIKFGMFGIHENFSEERDKAQKQNEFTEVVPDGVDEPASSSLVESSFRTRGGSTS